MAEELQDYVKAARFGALTRVYDPLVRLTSRESEFRRRLLDQAGLAPGQRVLDVGCGTGSLLLLAKERQPGIDAVGLDGDPEILGLARHKADAAGAEVVFDEGFSTELPYPDGSFDRVLSSLVLHHLTTADKRRTLTEIARVLKPDGELHVADWGRPSDPVMRGVFGLLRRFDGMEQTSANVRGELPALFREAGLEGSRERDRMRTMLGVLSLYSS